jgi:hypothetical protein
MGLNKSEALTCLYPFFIKHGSSVFGWKHQMEMVKQNRNIMAFVNVLAHHSNRCYRYQPHTP